MNARAYLGRVSGRTGNLVVLFQHVPFSRCSMPTFQAEPLSRLAERLFVAAGVPAADAGVVSRHLVDANLLRPRLARRHAVPQYLQFLNEGKFRANVPLDILSETPAVVAADANWGLGQVQAHRLLAKLVEKAQAVGVASGTLRNSGLSAPRRVCGDGGRERPRAHRVR